MVAAAEVAALVRSLPDHDAYLIACFGDPGLDAARELTDAPVVGIGEAAYIAAVARGQAVRRHHHAAARHPRARGGHRRARRCGRRCAGIVPLDIPVAEQGSGHPDTTAAIVAAGSALVADARRRRADPGLRRHGRRRASGRGRGRRAGLRRRRVRRRARPLAVALRPSHEQGRRLRARPSRSPTSACRADTVRAATFREYGGPEVMRWEELDDPACGRDDVIVRAHACGLNHSDLDSRAGTSRWPFTMPWVLGAEFAGTVAAVGGRGRGHRRRRPGHRLPAVRVRHVRGLRALAARPVRAVRGVRHRSLGRLRRAGGGAGPAVIPLRSPDDFVTAAAAQCVVSDGVVDGRLGRGRAAGRDGAGAVGVGRRGGRGGAGGAARRRARDRLGGRAREGRRGAGPGRRRRLLLPRHAGGRSGGRGHRRPRRRRRGRHDRRPAVRRAPGGDGAGRAAGHLRRARRRGGAARHHRAVPPRPPHPRLPRGHAGRDPDVAGDGARRRASRCRSTARSRLAEAAAAHAYMDERQHVGKIVLVPE